MAVKGRMWYAVKVGRKPGVYETWDEAQRQTDHFPRASFKSFKELKDAEAFAGKTHANTKIGYGARLLRRKRDSKVMLIDLSSDEEDGGEDKDRKPPLKKTASSASSTLAKEEDDAKEQIISPNTPAVADEPELSPQQAAILERICRGENYFFTGSAGTGKSVLLRAIIKAFKDRSISGKQDENKLFEKQWQEYIRTGGRSVYPKQSLVQKWMLGVTASTGMAGVNIGGSTVHSWAGIGLGELPVSKLVEIINKNNITRDRWLQTGALIIDEVSMIDATLFDKLEQIARRVRGNEQPFGGLQLIVSGDFFQLPPVARFDGPGYKFAFQAESWPKVFPKDNMSSLTRVFRQKENDFVRILEGMRKGIVGPEDLRVLARCDRNVKYDDGIEPVGLYPSKAEVARINDARLSALTTPLQQFLAWDTPGINSKGYTLTPEQATEVLDRNTIWVRELNLKLGAMVMLVTNMQDGNLVNGSTGVVVDFMTLHHAERDGVYIPSRARGYTPSPDIAWPVVEFIKAKHASGTHAQRTLIPSMAVDVLNAQGKPEAVRHQVPLILAWALTIHKSQGQTIERVRVDLNKIFVEGQTYVAISRAVSLETLEIRNFSMSKVMAHPRVIAWAAPFEQEQAEDEEWDDLLGGVELDF